MDIRKRKSRKHIQINSESNTESLKSLYPQNICFYTSPPFQDITLDKFKAIALERLSVLRILDNANMKNVPSSEWKNVVLSEIALTNLENYSHLLSNKTDKTLIDEKSILLARYNDYVSHFILRLVYCRSQELKSWFIFREIELFILKFSTLSESEIKLFFEVYQLNYKPIGNEEIIDIKDNLKNQSIYYEEAVNNNSDFYRIHFSQIPDLIQNRECFFAERFCIYYY